MGPKIGARVAGRQVLGVGQERAAGMDHHLVGHVTQVVDGGGGRWCGRWGRRCWHWKNRGKGYIFGRVRRHDKVGVGVFSGVRRHHNRRIS